MIAVGQKAEEDVTNEALDLMNPALVARLGSCTTCSRCSSKARRSPCSGRSKRVKDCWRGASSRRSSSPTCQHQF
eukprot:7401604-Pyramimonas_sp.AAC.1